MATPSAPAPAGTPAAGETGPATEALRIAGGLTAVLTLLLVAFAWPSSQLAPRDLPLAVVGPEPAVAQVSAALEQALGEGAVEVLPAASPEEAAALVEEREAAGALVPSPDGVEVLTAPAGSPAVAQLVTGLGERLAGDGSLTVTEVVPLPEGDPRGVLLGAASFPLVIGGVAAGAALALRVSSPRARLAGAVTVAAGAGLAFTAVLQPWLGGLAGSYLANAGVVALGLGAVALALLGLHRVLGVVGLALGALTVVLVGNPFSGMTSSPDLLPAGWSTLGQLLPPGAAGTALRSVAFFDGSGATVPLLVLTTYVVVGAALLLAPRRS